MTNHVEIKVALAYGPPVPNATAGKYSHTTVVVTDASGKPQTPVTLTGGKGDLTAIVQEGAGGNIVATDYDTDGKVLNTVTQEFFAWGTANDYKPTTTISVVTGAVVKPGIKPIYADDSGAVADRKMANNKQTGVATAPISPTPQTHAG